MKEYFDQIIGNDHVKGYLVNMIQKKAVGNSLLFAGPEEAALDQFALIFAKLLMGEKAHLKIDAGNHPDVHVYHPEGKVALHSISSMRQFCEEVYLPPYEGVRKVFILHAAERMLTYSANALLKTFEEPNLDSVIILLTNHPNSLLPTILSRCRTIRFQSVANSGGRTQKNGLKTAVLTILATGKVRTYTELQQSAAHLITCMEEIHKEKEDLKTEIQKIPNDQMNASQRQALEKEIEGAVAMRQNHDARELLGGILSWYRDLHLIHAGGRPELLENLDFQPALIQAYQRGEILPLEVVEKKIREARLSLDRSTALNLCLEKLFLELHLMI